MSALGGNMLLLSCFYAVPLVRSAGHSEIVHVIEILEQHLTLHIPMPIYHYTTQRLRFNFLILALYVSTYLLTYLLT